MLRVGEESTSGNCNWAVSGEGIMAGPQGNGALLASIEESQEQAIVAGKLNQTSQSRNSDRSSLQSHTIFNEEHEDEGGRWKGNGTS